MKLHIAICDDDEKHSFYIKTFVTAWGKSRSHTVETALFPNAEAFLFEYSDNKNFDILLLDIEMAKMNGIALARQLRKENAMLQIVFITGYDQYIADGYDVAALHYLLKPVNEDKLCSVLDRACRILQDREKHIVVNTGGTVQKIALDKIVYIEARQNYIEIHTEKDCFRVKMPLATVEKELDDGFFRIGRSYIVGLRYVKSIGKTEITLDTGEILPLGRGLYSKINDAFIKFF